MYVCIYIYIYLYLYPSVPLSVCPSVPLPLCPFARLPVCGRGGWVILCEDCTLELAQVSNPCIAF